MPQGTGKVTQPQLLNLRKNAKTWTEKHPEEEVEEPVEVGVRLPGVGVRLRGLSGVEPISTRRQRLGAAARAGEVRGQGCARRQRRDELEIAVRPGAAARGDAQHAEEEEKVSHGVSPGTRS